MQRGGFPRTRGAHRQNKAIGLGNNALHHFGVAFGHAHFIHLHRAGRSQNSHYDIFVTALGRQSGHAEFEGWDTFTPKFDLAVLGHPPFSNIQVGHDFHPGNDTPHHGIGDFHVLLADTIQPQTNRCRFCNRRRLNVDIGGIVTVSRNDNLVHKLDDFAGSFIVGLFFQIAFFFFFFKSDVGNQVKIINALSDGFYVPGRGVILIKKMPDILLDILTDGHGEINPVGLHQGLDIVGFIEVSRIVNQNLHAFLIPAHRNPVFV